MMRVAIRHAREEDLPAITSLLEEASLPTLGVYEHLRNFVVAEHGKTIVGTIGFELYGETALLRSAVVAASMRSKGIGTDLYDSLLSQAKTHRLRRIILLTTTAERYFRQKGFQRIDRTRVSGPVTSSIEFTRACPSDAVCMELHL